MLRGILAIALSVVLSLMVLGDSVLASGWYLNVLRKGAALLELLP